MSTVRQDLISDGSEFQVRGAVTENARRARLLRVLGTVSSGASSRGEDIHIDAAVLTSIFYTVSQKKFTPLNSL